MVPECSADVLRHTATVNCNYLQPTVELFLFPLLCLAAGGSHYHAGRWWDGGPVMCHVILEPLVLCPGTMGELYWLHSLDSSLVNL